MSHIFLLPFDSPLLAHDMPERFLKLWCCISQSLHFQKNHFHAVLDEDVVERNLVLVGKIPALDQCLCDEDDQPSAHFYSRFNSNDGVCQDIAQLKAGKSYFQLSADHL